MNIFHHCILYEIVYGHIVWIFIIILNRSIPLLSAQGFTILCCDALLHQGSVPHAGNHIFVLCRFIHNLSVFIELLKCDQLLLLVPIHVFLHNCSKPDLHLFA